MLILDLLPEKVYVTCGASSVPSFSARPDNRRMFREEEAGTWNRYSQKGWSAMFEDVDAEAEVVEAAGAACQLRLD